jgi:hypothetical protein
VTPETVKGAAFKEDGHANAGPIIDGVFFYIENKTGVHFLSTISEIY